MEHSPKSDSFSLASSHKLGFVAGVNPIKDI